MINNKKIGGLRHLAIALLGIIVFSQASEATENAPRRISSWPHVLGSHRVLIEVTNPADVVIAHIIWRRADNNPEKRALVLIDLKTNKRVRNFALVKFSRETVDLVFEPATVPGKYAFYYLPLKKIKKPRTGKVKYEYAKKVNRADSLFLERVGLGGSRYLEAGTFDNLPKAKVIAIESRTKFDSFEPMEVIATESEVAELKEDYPTAFILFPETRKYPIRMSKFLPYRWVKKAPENIFKAQVKRDEYFAFQVGVFAAQKRIKDLKVSFSDLTTSDGDKIPASNFELINRDINTFDGKKKNKTIAVPKNKVQALWFILTVPEDANPGKYVGEISFKSDRQEQKIKLFIEVLSAKIVNHGTDDLWRMARLKWLNSGTGLENQITAPYTALKLKGRTVKCLGKQVKFASNGLPSSIKSAGKEILARPIIFHLKNARGSMKFSKRSFKVLKNEKSMIKFIATEENNKARFQNRVRMEYDGYIFFNITITAKQNISLKDIFLEIPYRKDIAKYMMGLDIGRGGLRPKKVDWKWQNYPTNKVWMGNAQAGLRCKLRGAKELEHVWEERKPEINGIPKSWSNNSKGGACLREGYKHVNFRAFTGPMKLKRGEKISFNFSLLITPVKPRDPKHWFNPKGWRQRFSYMGCSPKDNQRLGAKQLVAFHGSPVNPCINYPFIYPQKIKKWVEDIHQLNLQAGLYYKIGELSNHCAELPVLQSLGDEILTPGTGKGCEWLQEHLRRNYSLKWYSIPFGDIGPADACIAINGGSRWENYYLASLESLIKNTGIDGLYFDGLGYSRLLMQRIRKTFERQNVNDFFLDFHIGNTITRRSNSFNDVMEHLPYLDSTWIGEGFNYNHSPAFYLVELSGIPFGVPNSMLQYGGNPWRGMLYGMSSRYNESIASTPINMWEFFDRIKIQDSRMIGYWDNNCPVKSDNKNILSTVYQFKDKCLIAIASWEKGDAECKLKIDWKKLNLSPTEVIAYAPEIPGFQSERNFDFKKSILIPEERGYLIVVEKKKSLPNLFSFKNEKCTAQPQSFSVNDLGKKWQKKLARGGAGNVAIKDNILHVQGPRNTFVFVERKLPNNISGIECQLKIEKAVKKRAWHDRFDGMQSPGISLVWGNGRTFRIHEASLGVWGIEDMRQDHMYRKQPAWKKAGADSWVYLRIFWNDKYFLTEVSVDGKNWNIIYRLPRVLFPGTPKLIRLGKITKDYGWPRTVRINNEGNNQISHYKNLIFYSTNK